MHPQANLIVFNQIKFLHRNFLFNQMKQEKYIFFYGGKDTVWIKQFKEQVYAMSQVFKPASISIELFYVEDKGEITYGNSGTALRAFSSAGTTSRTFYSLGKIRKPNRPL